MDFRFRSLEAAIKSGQMVPRNCTGFYRSIITDNMESEAAFTSQLPASQMDPFMLGVLEDTSGQSYELPFWSPDAFVSGQERGLDIIPGFYLIAEQSPLYQPDCLETTDAQPDFLMFARHDSSGSQSSSPNAREVSITNKRPGKEVQLTYAMLSVLC